MLDVITPEQLARQAHAKRSNSSQIKLSAKEGPLTKKDENEVEVLRKASLSSYVRVHNSMTNRLMLYSASRGRETKAYPAKDCCFDASEKNYMAGGHILPIEQKL